MTEIWEIQKILKMRNEVGRLKNKVVHKNDIQGIDRKNNDIAEQVQRIEKFMLGGKINEDDIMNYRNLSFEHRKHKANQKKAKKAKQKMMNEVQEIFGEMKNG